MGGKSRIIIISSGYPYGLKETFLHNEVLYLSDLFDIEIFPLIKGSIHDQPRELPANVWFHEPILDRSYLKRTVRGLFNLSPIWPHLRDLFVLLRSPRRFRSKVARWFLSLLIFRTFYSSVQFGLIKAHSSPVIYFYWANFPVEFLKVNGKRIFMRVHGGEVDLSRHHGYLPLVRHIFVRDANIWYLPVSNVTVANLTAIRSVNYFLNRLGVSDCGLNPNLRPQNYVRLVSCSNLIPLKRVHLIAKALSRITEVSIEWVHFGDGPLFHDIFVLSRTMPANISVKLFGRVGNGEVLRFYSENHVDLFINVSESEGVPVSIMEALSFGIPCFATDVGGTREIVSSKNGYLATKEFDIDELTLFVLRIASSRTNEILRRNARSTWERLSDSKVNFGGLARFFKEFEC